MIVSASAMGMVMGIALAACGPEGRARSEAPAGDAACASAPGAVAVNGLAATLRAPAAADSGRPVRVVVTVDNGGASGVAVWTGFHAPVELVVRASGDTAPLWRTGDGFVADAGRLDTLSAAGRLTFAAEWSQRTLEGHTARPGLYCLQAIVDVGQARPLRSAPHALRVQRRAQD